MLNHREDTRPTTTWNQPWGQSPSATMTWRKKVAQCYHDINSFTVHTTHYDINSVTWPTTTWTQLQWGCCPQNDHVHIVVGAPTAPPPPPPPLHLPPPSHSNHHHHHPTPTTTPSPLHPHPTPTPVEIIFSLSGFTARCQLGPCLG